MWLRWASISSTDEISRLRINAACLDADSERREFTGPILSAPIEAWASYNHCEQDVTTYLACGLHDWSCQLLSGCSLSRAAGIAGSRNRRGGCSLFRAGGGRLR